MPICVIIFYMKTAIISDIHNNTANLKKVLDYCADKKIKEMICCGDLASGETLDFLCDNFSGEIYYVFGNMDVDHENIRTREQKNNSFKEYKNTKVFKDFGETEIENKKVAFVHYPDRAKDLADSGKYDLVFYGHTHKPWHSEVLTKDTLGQKKCILLNPGNVANEIYPPTFAVWDTENDKFELIRINDLR